MLFWQLVVNGKIGLSGYAYNHNRISILVNNPDMKGLPNDWCSLPVFVDRQRVLVV